ncbi:MAG: valine--tRNA ligase [Candidatus Eisenbacteria bacterium]|nr:valine--tRNA ligase [Candidatus Eisenbacteria bacterium]
MKLPKRYNPRECEPKWQRHWESLGIYRFDRYPDRPIYSIDTPPPTVSGRIHVGHVFSYVQAEVVARFWRMRGHNVYYPFGFDDNGLPSERLVEKEKGVKATDVGREKFVKMCLELTKRYEDEFKTFWQSLGLSVDWNEDYSTIDPLSQRISQRSFIDLYRKGRVYRKEAPTLWCPECHTAIAQAEIEDAEQASVFYDVAFEQDGRDLVISTTRPELLPACVGMFAHPSDERYQNLIGKTARVPLFGLDVPIMADEKADPEKGTGLVMCCTFGDTTDIAWWQEHGLRTRIVFDGGGMMNELAPGYEGLSLTEARSRIVADLETSGRLRGQRPISHVVNVHERCGTGIEFSVASQWFIRVLDIKDRMLEAGSKVQWCPAFMAVRFNNWVENLRWDWCVSRQRYYGVPFPLWTCKACGEVVLADESQLPVDPAVTTPPVEACAACGSKEFEPELDIMDTWMTSSCTPFINLRWREPDSKIDRFRKPAVSGGSEYMMDLRPQAHDIIRTWAFYTIVKGVLNEGKIPWKTAMISGHTLHPDRAKISKSKGDAGAAPSEIVEERSADVTRYWACSARLGTDTILAEEPLDAGHRLVVKLWNASKFALMRLEDYDPGAVMELGTIDRWLLAELKQAVEKATVSFEACDYHGALEAAERFFWHDLCDNYIEIAKKRLYGDAGYDESAKRGAQYALYHALLSALKMFAPMTPHIVEEIHSLYFAEREGVESIHVSQWPEPPADWDDERALTAGRVALAVIEGMRKIKSTSKVSVATPVTTLRVACDDSTWAMIEPLSTELMDVSSAETLERIPDTDRSSSDDSFVETSVGGIFVSADLVESGDGDR